MQESTAAEIDQERLDRAFRRLGDLMVAGHVAGLVALGLRLGLFEAMAGAGPVTSSELAVRTRLHERWVREWLYAQSAGGVLEHALDGDGHDRFHLTPEVAALLADRSSLLYMGNKDTSSPSTHSNVPARTSLRSTTPCRGASDCTTSRPTRYLPCRPSMWSRRSTVSTT